MILMDFDGVIADSQDAVLNAINELAAKRNKQGVSREEYASTPVRQLFSRLEIPTLLAPYYVRVMRKSIASRMKDMRLHAEILPVMAWAQSRHVPLGILSSNATEVIRGFVAAHTPQFQFAAIQGNCGLWAKHRYLAKLATRHGKSVNDSVYLGDETRDMDAAHRVGMRSIAVAWGKDSADLLMQSSPSCLARTGEDVVRYLELAPRSA